MTRINMGMSYLREITAMVNAARLNEAAPVAAPRTTKDEVAARGRVNTKLHGLGNYHDGIPVDKINRILTDGGFGSLEPAIYCGADGKSHEQVGPHTWFAMTWHRMSSGRMEIVSYLS